MVRDDGDKAIIEAGYQPRLRRSLGFFSTFSVSFSCISILLGVAANYGFVLGKGGPFGYWTWLIVAAGHMMVALVFAEMAGRIPLTGCAYNWNTRIANPTLGWFTGWTALMAYVLGVAATTATLIPVLQALLGYTFDADTVRYIGLSFVLLQAVINIYSVRLAASINGFAVGAEIIAVIVFSLLIAGATMLHGHPNFALLTTIPAEPRPYWPAFLVSCLMASWTIIGFESSADVSEETVNTRRVTPRSIVWAVAICSLAGFVFIVVLTLAIPDVKTITAAADPMSAIVSYRLGEPLTKVFLALVFTSILACALMAMTATSRLVYAMSRDRRFPGSAQFVKVSGHHVPHMAIWLVTAVAMIFLWFAASATALYGATAVLFALYYLITVVSFASSRKKLSSTDSFSLGKWHWPVVVVAISWLVIEIGILTIPAEFHDVAIATGGILAAGVVVFCISGRTKKKPGRS